MAVAVPQQQAAVQAGQPEDWADPSPGDRTEGSAACKIFKGLTLDTQWKGKAQK